jgi:methanogen homoisocitrate dehydrogenase
MAKIAVIEGDGIGKEVIPVAVDVIRAVRPDLEIFPVEVGYGRWERTGEAITPADISALKTADAILFGAVTTPPDPGYKSVVVRMRKELDLYANVRPVKGGGVDIVIVRENTEGLYAGIEEVGPDRATSLRVITRAGTERIARFACTLAKGRRHLTIGHKANVLKADTLFREICFRVARDMKVPCTEKLIDALCLDVLRKPGDYDVIVTENMFGDILSDVAAYLVGGLGMLPGANIGDRYALFEPVHGSAPAHAGRDTANPVAAIRSGAMLLEHLDDGENAALIEKAIEQTLASGVKTRDLGGRAGTREMGKAIISALES